MSPPSFERAIDVRPWASGPVITGLLVVMVQSSTASICLGKALSEPVKSIR